MKKEKGSITQVVKKRYFHMSFKKCFIFFDESLHVISLSVLVFKISVDKSYLSLFDIFPPIYLSMILQSQSGY